MKLDFSWQISKSPQITDVTKIHPVGAGLFHVDGQTNRYDEANSHLLQFCECA
jgi:hypothetical protein